MDNCEPKAVMEFGKKLGKLLYIAKFAKVFSLPKFFAVQQLLLCINLLAWPLLGCKEKVEGLLLEKVIVYTKTYYFFKVCQYKM